MGRCAWLCLAHPDPQFVGIQSNWYRKINSFSGVFIIYSVSLSVLMAIFTAYGGQ